jgi:phosphatidylglycerophosphate synthase
MSKSGNNLQCSYDNIIYNKISPLIAPKLVEIGITPNMITTLTLIIRTTLLYLLFNNYFVKHKFLIFILIWNITNFTDALDGYIARKYKMGSELGAKYDSFVDDSSYILLYIILFKNIFVSKIKNKFLKIIIFVFILIDLLYISLSLTKLQFLKINNNKEELDITVKLIKYYKNPIKNRNDIIYFCLPNVYNIIFILYYILFIVL